MEPLEEIIAKNLESSYLMFSSSHGGPFRRPREIQEELIDYKSKNSYKAIHPQVSSYLKRRKTEIIKEKNPFYNPSTNPEQLSELLQKSSNSSTLEVFQNKYLNLKLKSIEPTWHAP